MELKVESTMTSVGLKMIVLSAFISVSLSQTVMVDMKSKLESNPRTASATLTCDFRVDDDSYDFSNLEWRRNGSLVADFFGGTFVPDYQHYCLSSSNCEISRTESKSDFVISSLDMTTNNEPFSCQVTFSKVADTINGQNSTVLIVVVSAETIEMSNGSSSEPFTNGSKVPLSSDVNSHIFQCVVADINPQAAFTWTVGGKKLQKDITTESHVVDIGTGLTTSTSNATLTPDFDYNGEDLICKAVNYEGDPGVMFLLVLEVEEPTMDSSIPSSPSSKPPTVGNSAGGLSLVWKIVIGVCVAAVIILGE